MSAEHLYFTEVPYILISQIRSPHKALIKMVVYQHVLLCLHKFKIISISTIIIVTLV